jgi:prepilin signal peptidase PulO-like enzyme (type II secretory pathway)
LITLDLIYFEYWFFVNFMLSLAVVFFLLFSFLPGASEPLYALLGGAAGFGLFLLISLLTRGTLGAGDVKLAGVIGLMTGFPAVFMALLWGIILGGVGALALMALGRAGRKTYIAYAPYLCLGAIIALWRVL